MTIPMTKLKIFLILFLFSASLQAQSYLSVLTGVDAANIAENISYDLFDVRDDPYNNKSLLLGLRYDCTLSKKLFISASSTAAKYSVNTYTLTFTPILKMDFYQVKNSLNLNYSILKNWYAGVGICYSYVPYLKTLNAEKETYHRIYNKHQISFNIATGFIYKRFLLELNYVKGKKNLYEYNYFRPIDNLGVHAGFMFKLPKVFNKKEVKCPRF
jgi:hypothetical protein